MPKQPFVDPALEFHEKNLLCLSFTVIAHKKRKKIDYHQLKMDYNVGVFIVILKNSKIHFG